MSRTNNLAWALVIAAVTLACPPAIADTLAQLRKEADECQSGFDSATLDVGQPMTSAEWIDVQIESGDLAHAKWATARFQSIVEDGRARRSVSPKRSELGKRPVTNEALTEIAGNSRSAADSKRIGASEKASLISRLRGSATLPWTPVALAIGLVVGLLCVLRAVQRRSRKHQA